MWPIKRKSAEELDSILYFLSSALTSVIDESSYLAHHQAAIPRIGAGLATAEIASRLATFRQQVCDVSEREFVVVTKLARARHWAQELRRYEPHLRADIDAFLRATARCEALVRDRASDPQSLFDGHAQPKRFLADRVPGGRLAAEAAMSLMERLEAAERGEAPADDAPRYLIGGEMSVEALNEACETMLARLSAHYGWEEEAQGLPADDEALAESDEPETAEADEDMAVANEAQDEIAEADQTEAGENDAEGDAITDTLEESQAAAEPSETQQGEEVQESEKPERAETSASEAASEESPEAEKKPESEKAANNDASSEPKKMAATTEPTAESEASKQAFSG